MAETASMLIGFVFATISVAVAMKWTVGYLDRHSLVIFSIYPVAMAVGQL